MAEATQELAGTTNSEAAEVTAVAEAGAVESVGTSHAAETSATATGVDEVAPAEAASEAAVQPQDEALRPAAEHAQPGVPIDADEAGATSLVRSTTAPSDANENSAGDALPSAPSLSAAAVVSNQEAEGSDDVETKDDGVMVMPAEAQDGDELEAVDTLSVRAGTTAQPASDGTSSGEAGDGEAGDGAATSAAQPATTPLNIDAKEGDTMRPAADDATASQDDNAPPLDGDTEEASAGTEKVVSATSEEEIVSATSEEEAVSSSTSAVTSVDPVDAMLDTDADTTDAVISNHIGDISVESTVATGQSGAMANHDTNTTDVDAKGSEATPGADISSAAADQGRSSSPPHSPKGEATISPAIASTDTAAIAVSSTADLPPTDATSASSAAASSSSSHSPSKPSVKTKAHAAAKTNSHPNSSSSATTDTKSSEPTSNSPGHRLYQQAQESLRRHDNEARKVGAERPPECTFKPALYPPPASVGMSASEGDSKDTTASSSRFERLYKDGARIKEERDKQVEEAQRALPVECTFGPRVYSGVRGNSSVETPAARSAPEAARAAAFERLYEQGKAQVQAQEEAAAARKKILPEQCTFSPVIRRPRRRKAGGSPRGGGTGDAAVEAGGGAASTATEQKTAGPDGEAGAGSTAVPVFTRLYTEGQNRLVEQKHARAKQRKKPHVECTFKPATNRTSARRRSRSKYGKSEGGGKEGNEGKEAKEAKDGVGVASSGSDAAGRGDDASGDDEVVDGVATGSRLYEDGRRQLEERLKQVELVAKKRPNDCTFQPTLYRRKGSRTTPAGSSTEKAQRACVRLYQHGPTRSQRASTSPTSSPSGDVAPVRAKGSAIRTAMEVMIMALETAPVDSSASALENGEVALQAYKQEMGRLLAVKRTKQAATVDRLYGQAEKRRSDMADIAAARSKDVKNTDAECTFAPKLATATSRGEPAKKSARSACARLYQSGVDNLKRSRDTMDRVRQARPPGCTFSPNVSSPNARSRGRSVTGTQVDSAEGVLEDVIAAVCAADKGGGRSRDIIEQYSASSEKRAIASKVASEGGKKQQERKREPGELSTFDKLYKEGDELRKRRDAEAVNAGLRADSTFHPKINAFKGVPTDHDPAWHDKLYSSGAEKRERMKELRTTERHSRTTNTVDGHENSLLARSLARPQGTSEYRQSAQTKWEAECTFAPRINAGRKDGDGKKRVDGAAAEGGEDRFTDLYNDAEKHRKRIDDLNQLPPANCTFKPKTNEAGHAKSPEGVAGKGNKPAPKDTPRPPASKPGRHAASAGNGRNHGDSPLVKRIQPAEPAVTTEPSPTDGATGDASNPDIQPATGD